MRVTLAGHGFVQTAEGEYFIPRKFMADAWDGDAVVIAPVTFRNDRSRSHGSDDDSSHGRHGRGSGTSAIVGERRLQPTARVTSVLRRNRTTVVGRYEIADPFGVVVPEDPHIHHDIFTMRKDFPDVHDGDYVRVRIVQFPTAHSAATGKIECVLGHDGDPGVDIDALVDRLGISTRFSEAAAHEADSMLENADSLAGHRRDNTDTFTITIDPTDARDFDDAVSLERVKGAHGDSRLRLSVHIADVTSYVEWGSAIDRDARKRGTSVYLADRVIPMLPERISNDLCSLVPGKPRRAFTVEAILDGDGRVLSANMYPSTIRSSARLSYEQADCYIRAAHKGLTARDAREAAARCPHPEGALDIDDATSDRLFTMLADFFRIARKLAEHRKEEGAIRFSHPEAHVLLDDKGVAVGVDVRRETPATSSIEQAMVLANRIVARTLDRSGLPSIYRVHGAPKRSSLEHLLPVLQEVGVTHGIDIDEFCAGSPFAIQQVLDRSRGTNDEELVSSLVLRAMKRAEYADACLGHFGLGAQYYCHFTSPIRRYPDLEVHRMLKMRLFGRDGTFSAQESHMAQIAEHCSEMERIADDAELESTQIKLVQYMQGFVGKTFDGIVSGVSRAGVFVTLQNTAEGLIPLSTLGDERFSFNESMQQLQGQDSRTRYRLGQRIKVRIFAAPDHAMRLELRRA